jgi:DNA polymerase-3 subunit epsilon
MGDIKLKYYERNLAIVDTETTGLLTENHEIIEVAGIIYDRKTDRVLDEWEEKIAPRKIETADPEALKINGYINNPELYKANIKPTMLKFNNLVKDCIIVGVNIQFDLNFLEKAMKEFSIEPSWDRHRRIDLMSMAWAYVQDLQLAGLGLRNLCDHFNLSNEGQHTALIDCRRTLSVYRCLMDVYRKR